MSFDGSTLLYSTFLGGSSSQRGSAVATDRSGNAYIAGDTTSSDFPTTPGAYQSTLASSAGNGFISKFALGGPSTIGTEFWLTFPDNSHQSDGAQQQMLQITAPSGLAASGTVSIPGLGFSQAFSVPAGGSAIVNIPAAAELRTDDGTGGNGIHVVASAPVSVCGFDYDPANTDSFTALPTSALGTTYVILGYATQHIAFGSNNLSSELALVASQDGTVVTVTPSAATTNHMAQAPFTITLNAGQTYELQATQFGADLTGTTVTSNNPIACYGGTTLSNLPSVRYDFGNHLVEQLPPADRWGTHFFTTPLATRSHGDTFRILASRADTHFVVTGQTGLGFDGLPAGGFPVLQAGGFVTINIQGMQEITSDKPILVAQYSNSGAFDNVPGDSVGPFGDPSMMLVPAVSQYLTRYAVRTPDTGFMGSYLNITVPTAALSSNDVTLDGLPLVAASFSPIGTTSGYSSGAITVTGAATHVVASTSGATSFGVTSYGFGEWDAYSNPAGMSLANFVGDPNGAAPAAPTNVQAAALSPTSVHLSWTDSAGATGYFIEVGVMVNGQIEWTVVAVVPNGMGGYTITGLNPDTTYYFQVIAYNGSNDSPPVEAPGNLAGGGTHTPGLPPGAPSLNATSVSQSEIDLAWTPGGGGAPATYNIQWTPGSGGDGSNWQPLTSPSAPTQSFADTGLAPVTTYSYRMSATNTWGTSPYSSVATAETQPVPPGAPIDFTAVAGATPTQVNLAWQNSDSLATSFTIQRSQSPTLGWQTVLNPGAGSVSATDGSCQPATTYYYRICANINGASSAWVYANADSNGNPGPVTTLTPPLPGAPSNLIVTGVTPTEIDLAWTDGSLNTPNGGQATGFQIQRHPGAAGSGTYAPLANVAALPTTYADTGLTPGSTFTYRVCATNAAGSSSFSNEVTATTPTSAYEGNGDGPDYLAVYPTSSSSLRVYWSAVTGATGYNIYRSTTPGIAVTLMQPVATRGASPLNFDDYNLQSGQMYYYVVRAILSSGISDASPEDGHYPNSSAIPWNANSDAILSAVRSQLQYNQDNWDEDDIASTPIRVMAPDGTVYDEGNPNPEPREGSFDPSTGMMNVDGTEFPINPDFFGYPDGDSGCFLPGSISKNSFAYCGREAYQANDKNGVSANHC